MNKLKLLIIFCILAETKFVIAQNLEFPSDSLVKNLSQNYVVPDLPAFNALNTSATNLLRPSTAKDLAVVLGNFYNGRNITIPNSIAIEVAPITIAKANNLILSDYQKCPAFYNLRISIGTLIDSGNVSKVALGLRTTFIDKGDIKNKNNLSKIINLQRFVNNQRQAYIDLHSKQGPIDTTEQIRLSKQFDKLHNDTISKLIQKMKGDAWNAERFDAAIVFVGASPDSLAKNIKYNSFSFWSSYCLPLNSNGQIIFGVYLNNYKEVKNYYTNFSLPIRIYIGTNDLKAFIEGQYSYNQISKSNNLLINFGCEHKLYSNIWVQLMAGLNKDFTNNTSSFVTNFRLIYTLPGKI